MRNAIGSSSGMHIMGMPSIPTRHAKTQLESRAVSTGMQDSATVPAMNNVYNLILALYNSRSVGVPSNVS